MNAGCSERYQAFNLDFQFWTLFVLHSRVPRTPSVPNSRTLPRSGYKSYKNSNESQLVEIAVCVFVTRLVKRPFSHRSCRWRARSFTFLKFQKKPNELRNVIECFQSLKQRSRLVHTMSFQWIILNYFESFTVNSNAIVLSEHTGTHTVQPVTNRRLAWNTLIIDAQLV